MTTFLIYILTAGILLASLYLLWKLTLSKLTFFTFNRWAILAIYAISFLAFPAAGLCRSFFTDADDSPTGMTATGLPEVTVTRTATFFSTPKLPQEGIEVIITLYFLGMGVCLALTGATLFHIVKVIRNGQRIGNTDMIITGDSSLAPFSIAGNIIMSREDLSTASIAVHERYHLDARHWIDLIIAQIAIALQWFNPAAWLLRNEMRDQHEYAADRAVTSSGFNMKEYQLTLIRKAAGKKFAALANCLNHSKTKKRITMMIKKDSKRGAQLRALSAIPVVAIALWSVNTEALASALTPMERTADTTVSKISEKIGDAQPLAPVQPAVMQEPSHAPDITSIQTNATQAPVPAKVTSGEDEKTNLAVDQVAEYPGGQSAMIKFLSENTRYPEEAIKNNESGRVIVRFDIDKDGTVSNPVILKGVSASLDREAIRLVNMMPKWEPAQLDGKAVKSRFTLPVSFKLSEPQPKTE